MFQKPKEKEIHVEKNLETGRFQINYVLTKHRYKNSVKNLLK